ncbi:MAG: hypothetical protein PHU85_00970 [Phycisphaerae bacterium]|nr:hypothetical protein [Phycisphaerae bacterium]
MKRTWWLSIVLGVGMAMPVLAADKDKKEAMTPAERLAIADKTASGLVVVEYTLQYDKGESPPAHEGLIRDERPLEAEGWLIGATEVVTRDYAIHPRFVKAINVRFGDQAVPATIAGYFSGCCGITLKLSAPLAKAKPIEFKDVKAPYFFVDYTLADARWTTTVLPVEMAAVVRTEAGRTFANSSAVYSLVVDKDGEAVGILMKERFPLDGSWKGSPAKWPIIAAADMDKQLKELEAKANAAVLRVKLHFRSPKKSVSRYSGEGGPTELSVLGLLLGEKKLLVLSNLEPKVTARLERIEVFPATGEAMSAKFTGSLTDFGGFLAEIEKPVPGAMKLSTDPIEKCRDRTLLAIDVRIQGDQRVVYYVRERISAYELGWQRRVFPDIYTDNILIDPAGGEVLVLPLKHREKVAVRERGNQGQAVMPAVYLAEALADAKACFDPANVPLTEDEENRIAWLGVELQPMDPALARENKVADITNNGRTGAIVSYVYPNSPAGKAGVEAGWMLIRLHVPGQPKPLDVKMEYYADYLEKFPWGGWDKLPEEYFDRVPSPWPPVENWLNRTLTDLGVGKTFKAEFFADGKLVTREFTIELSPPHYGTAARFTSKGLGLTVRDLTYEARRYFQKKPADPGVVISKLDPGSKSAIAGIKPLEIIEAVNGTPVQTVKEFETLVGETKGELRLNVKRMARGRLVKIDMTAPAPKTQPAKPDAPPDGAEQ